MRQGILLQYHHFYLTLNWRTGTIYLLYLFTIRYEKEKKSHEDGAGKNDVIIIFK